MPIEAATEGEKIIQLEGKIDMIDGKVTYVVESLERIIRALEALETTRLADHEQRIQKLERWWSEWRGVNKFGILVSLLLGIVAILFTFLGKH